MSWAEVIYLRRMEGLRVRYPASGDAWAKEMLFEKWCFLSWGDAL